MGKSFIADIPGNFFARPIGSHAAVASDGAAARFVEGVFVAPANLKILSIWRVVQANEATAATDSYRTIECYNGGTSGTATSVGLGTYNNTVSAAQYGSVAFTLAATPTMTAGAMMYFSHSTVGTDNNDGTAIAAANLQIAYELL